MKFEIKDKDRADLVEDTSQGQRDLRSSAGQEELSKNLQSALLEQRRHLKRVQVLLWCTLLLSTLSLAAVGWNFWRNRSPDPQSATDLDKTKSIFSKIEVPNNSAPPVGPTSSQPSPPATVQSSAPLEKHEASAVTSPPLEKHAASTVTSVPAASPPGTATSVPTPPPPPPAAAPEEAKQAPVGDVAPPSENAKAVQATTQDTQVDNPQDQSEDEGSAKFGATDDDEVQIHDGAASDAKGADDKSQVKDHGPASENKVPDEGAQPDSE